MDCFKSRKSSQHIFFFQKASNVLLDWNPEDLVARFFGRSTEDSPYRRELLISTTLLFVTKNSLSTVRLQADFCRPTMPFSIWAPTLNQLVKSVAQMSLRNFFPLILHILPLPISWPELDPDSLVRTTRLHCTECIRKYQEAQSIFDARVQFMRQ